MKLSQLLAILSFIYKEEIASSATREEERRKEIKLGLEIATDVITAVAFTFLAVPFGTVAATSMSLANFRKARPLITCLIPKLRVFI